MENVFTNIYENNAWGTNDNVWNNKKREYNGSSGDGSKIKYNRKTYIPLLTQFILKNNIKSVVDLGSGDFLCGKIIYDNLNVIYNGYDAYKKVIDYNSKHYLQPKYTFTHLDFCNNKENILNGELCILKDVIQHWSLQNIYTFLDYLIEHKMFKYILICNCGYQTIDNTDIVDGEFRPLSCDFLPLKKYNPIKIYKYDTKEVSIIKLVD